MRGIGRKTAALLVAVGIGAAACGSSGGGLDVSAPSGPATPTARATTATTATRAATAPPAPVGTVAATAATPRTTATTPHKILIPLRIVRQGGAALVFADVTVGSSKLVFIVDTGASTTLIDQRVAQRLHLPDAGLPVRISGVAGAGTGQPVRLTNWKIGNSRLPARTVLSSQLTLGGSTVISGLLGSDVLASFGTVTIDYRNQRASLGA